MNIECGDYHDNMTVLSIACQYIKSGRVREGLGIVRQLRDFIQQRADAQSQKWILPKLDLIESGVMPGLA